MKDLGFFGPDEGYTAVAGGKGGGTARIGRELATGLTGEEAVTLARKAIAYYRENAKPSNVWVKRSNVSVSTRSSKR